MTTTGEIPQSSTLAEATSDSIGELLSKDPFKFGVLDRAKIVGLLREQRVKWEASEAAEGSKPRATKATANAAASLVAKVQAKDLGI